MVHFFLKKYLETIKADSSRLLLCLVPVLAYLVFAASQYDHFTIFQDISLKSGAPIAVSGSPVDTSPITSIAAAPDDFFLNGFALSELFQLLNPGTPRDVAKNQTPILADEINKRMSMTLPQKNKVRISFSGMDRQTGEKMVVYFSGRLIRKAQEGQQRAALQSGNAGLAANQSSAKLSGSLQVKGERSLFRPSRLLPSLLILVVSFVIVLIWFAVQEWLDPSFKSERQATRYLELNSLGTLPDLGEVSKTIGSAPKG